jgi:hypothetical protein
MYYSKSVHVQEVRLLNGMLDISGLHQSVVASRAASAIPATVAVTLVPLPQSHSSSVRKNMRFTPALLVTERYSRRDADRMSQGYLNKLLYN